MFIIIDTSAGDPQFMRAYGMFATEAMARGVVISTGEGGRLDDTLWVVNLQIGFP